MEIVISGEQHSSSTLTMLFCAALTLISASLTLIHPISLSDTFLSVLTAACEALMPILMLLAYRKNSDEATNHMWLAEVSSSEPSSMTFGNRFHDVIKSLSRSTCNISQLSTILLLPVLLVSGEVPEISHNSYILDVAWIWRGLAATSVLNGLLLTILLLLVRNISPFKVTFFHVSSFGILLLILDVAKGPQGWISLFVSALSCAALVAIKQEDKVKSKMSALRNVIISIRNILLAIAIYTAIYQARHLIVEGLVSKNLASPFGAEEQDIHLPRPGPLPKISKPMIKIYDDYLGPRPHTDTVADVPLMVAKCNEVAGGLGVDDIVQCLAFLENEEREYFDSPEKSLAENQTSVTKESRQSEDFNNKAVSESKSGAYKGARKGSKILYHVYWTGPGTWRFELFIKAYLYSQNVPCSQLWIWVDSDIDPQARENMLLRDKVLHHFRPLMDSGDIVVKNWTIHARIPVPGGIQALDTPGTPQKGYPNAQGEVSIGDNLVQDAAGMLWLVPNPIYKSTASTVAVSDAVRFIVLHLHGGVYLDMDVLLLRDLRPLILSDSRTGAQTAFAEQWVERCAPADYNTAVISLPANSSLSSYLVHGGLRMGMNFHPKVIGRMMWKDGRNDELAMLHNAVFDPLVTNLRRERTDSCTVPCHKNFQSAFLGVVEEPWNEWNQYRGEQASVINGTMPAPDDYIHANNRSLEHFFRGSFAYHIHNQVCDHLFYRSPQETSEPAMTTDYSFIVAKIPRPDLLDGRHHTGAGWILRR